MAKEIKDSGIEWVGDIPADWNRKKLKYVTTYNDESLPENTDGEYEFDYIDIGSVEYGKGITQYQRMRFKNAPSRARRIVKKNDIILSTVRTYLKAVAKISDRPITQIASTGFVVLRAKENGINSQFLNYAVLSNAFISMVEAKSVGISYPAINASVVVDLSLPIPPIDEQQRIADFLDIECTRIDTVIEQTRASIEEYKKLKQAVITQAVTKGIRPNRQMKDSGVEWIGEIPTDWGMCKLRHIGTAQNGISKGGDFFGEGYPFVSYGDVYRNMTLPRKVKGLIKSTEEEQKLYSVEKGDIFFTRTSETIEEVGFSSVCEETIPKATFAGFLIRVRPYDDTLDTGYAKYYFRSNHHRFYLVKQMNLVTRASLGQPLLKGMPVLVPNKIEQIEIAEYLDEQCLEIDRVITAKERIMSELETNKKSLIYEYVTGKKEVPV